MRDLGDLAEVNPGCRPEASVADDTMHTTGGNIDDVIDILVPAMLAFLEVAGRLTHHLSLDANIASSTQKPAASLSQRIVTNNLYSTSFASLGSRYITCQ